jgi:hypothetical protein
VIEAEPEPGKNLGYCLPRSFLFDRKTDRKTHRAGDLYQKPQTKFQQRLPFLHDQKNPFSQFSIILKWGRLTISVCSHVHEFYRDFISKKEPQRTSCSGSTFFVYSPFPGVIRQRVSVDCLLAFSSLPQFIKRITSADIVSQKLHVSPCMLNSLPKRPEQAQLVVTITISLLSRHKLSQPWQNAIVDESEQLPRQLSLDLRPTIDPTKSTIVRKILKI